MSLIKLVALLILADTAIGQAHLFSSVANDWYSYVLSLHAQHVLFIAFILHLIPYKNIASKTIVFIFLISEVWDIIQFLYVGDIHLIVSIAASIIIFVPWMMYAIYRSYDVESDDIKKDMIYKVSHKPDCFTDFICSLVFEKPTSGSGVLINDTLYIYRHGQFQEIEFSKLNKCGKVVIATGIHKDNEIVSYLHSMIGKDWMPWRNCVTMQFHLRMMHRARKS